MQAKEPDKQWDVTCSYCEVYNELIFDLLQDSSPPLDLRLSVLRSPFTAHIHAIIAGRETHSLCHKQLIVGERLHPKQNN